ncbi:MAG: hypothetical protein R2701_02065 [Acidimicrobiales bacterium]
MRAYLEAIAAELSNPVVDDAVEMAAVVVREAEIEAAALTGEANRILDDARSEADRLREEGDAYSRDLQAERARCERDATDLLESARAKVEEAERDAERLRRDAALEAHTASSGRWQDAGDMVSRILANAEIEADRLIGAAEGVATEIRRELKDEVAAARAEADRHGAEVRARADEYAEARLARAESDLAQLNESLKQVRATADQLEAEAASRSAAMVKRAEERVAAHVNEQLNQARVDLERTQAAEIEATARLSRVQRLVEQSLAVSTSDRRADIDDPDAFLLRLAEMPTEARGSDDSVEADLDEERPAG